MPHSIIRKLNSRNFYPFNPHYSHKVLWISRKTAEKRVGITKIIAGSQWAKERIRYEWKCGKSKFSKRDQREQEKNEFRILFTAFPPSDIFSPSPEIKRQNLKWLFLKAFLYKSEEKSRIGGKSRKLNQYMRERKNCRENRRRARFIFKLCEGKRQICLSTSTGKP